MIYKLQFQTPILPIFSGAGGAAAVLVEGVPRAGAQGDAGAARPEQGEREGAGRGGEAIQRGARLAVLQDILLLGVAGRVSIIEEY